MVPLRRRNTARPIADIQATGRQPEASTGFGWRTYGRSYGVSFTGGKNGEEELGPLKDYFLDYDRLRARSWQAYLDSELVQTVLGKYVTWIIGQGLRPQANPVKLVLESEGIRTDISTFNKLVEARFGVYADSAEIDHANMANLPRIASRAFANSITGGDVLVIQRYVPGRGITVQLIDGCHVQSPELGTDAWPQQLASGNIIRHGVETDASGQHVRYYVRNRDFTFTTIEARSPTTGFVTAYLVDGLEYRLDNVRSIPLISAILEAVKILDRYKTATLGAAEEQSKIGMQILHNEVSTGENPIINNLMKAYNNSVLDAYPSDSNGVELARNVQATFNKQTINMPRGAELKALNNSTGQLYFKEFYSVNINVLCAVLQIPPDIALSNYNSNYSASRAAIKDWEQTIMVKRAAFAYQFYRRIYAFWLHTQILENKIMAPGYLQAFFQGNKMITAAYANVRFVGASVPHIDPLKEVKAVREKLGTLGASLPLTTLEQATEQLNEGDSDNNMEQFSREKERAEFLEIYQDDATLAAAAAPDTTDAEDPATTKSKNTDAED